MPSPTQPNLIHLEELAVQDVIDAERNAQIANRRSQEARRRLDRIRDALGYTNAVQRQQQDRRRRSVIRLLAWIPGMAATGELLHRAASQHRIITAAAAGTGVVAAATITAITLVPAITPSGDEHGEHPRPAVAVPTVPTPAPSSSSPPPTPTPTPSAPGSSPTMLPELIPAATPTPHRHTPRPRRPAPVPTADPLAGHGPPSGVPAVRPRKCVLKSGLPVDLPPVACRHR